MVHKRRRSKGLGNEPLLLALTRRIPPGWLVVTVFSGIVGCLVLFIAFASSFVPPDSSEAEQCRKQCHPRFSALEDDKSYPMPTRGQYRKVCRCS